MSATPDYALTPSQTIGPLYGFALLTEGIENSVDPGSPDAIGIAVSVADGNGELIPYPDTLIEASHGDQWVRARAGENGLARFTVRKPDPEPTSYGTLAPHLNIVVFASGLLKQAVTRLYFPDEDDLNAEDPVLARIPADLRRRMIARETGDGLRFDIHLQGVGESVFFHF
ncbi:protocatechuate 3,4-dioxygenase subunit alpha [Amycolatopsis japonica]